MLLLRSIVPWLALKFLEKMDHLNANSSDIGSRNNLAFHSHVYSEE